jgi:uncharacterized protein (DUF2237 family)
MGYYKVFSESGPMDTPMSPHSDARYTDPGGKEHELMHINGVPGAVQDRWCDTLGMDPGQHTCWRGYSQGFLNGYNHVVNLLKAKVLRKELEDVPKGDRDAWCLGQAREVIQVHFIEQTELMGNYGYWHTNYGIRGMPNYIRTSEPPMFQ